MAKKDKLIRRLKSKPKDFTFAEMEALLLSLNFNKSNKGRTSGSRVAFNLDNIDFELHKPHPNKELPEYIINKAIRVLESEGLI